MKPVAALPSLQPHLTAFPVAPCHQASSEYKAPVVGRRQVSELVVLHVVFQKQMQIALFLTISETRKTKWSAQSVSYCSNNPERKSERA